MRNKWIIDMSFADLRGVNLSEAMKLDSISLEGANLERANLSGTDLFEADLSDANLFRTNLSETNLIGAKVTTEQLKQAMSLKGAIMPDGTKHT
jgi:uncharacterized protein YjbI with pentapeptide repeats